MKYVVNLNEVNLSDVGMVGGKNASTGEMIQNLSPAGIRCPGGFATTVAAYKAFLEENKLNQKITEILSSLNVNNLASVDKTRKQIRQWIISKPLSPQFEEAVSEAYAKMKNATVAVRSSATTEDLATASFAGAQETFLNVKGIQNILQAI